MDMDSEQFLLRYRFPLGTAVAIYFRERGGHLYLKPLGTGCGGQVMLVRPVDDRTNVKNPTLFARKRGCGDSVYEKAQVNEEYTVPDYAYPGKTHPSIPRVFTPDFFGSLAYSPGFAGHVVYQDFCNGGNLYELRVKYAEARKAVPETFIWVLLRKITEVLRWLHQNNLVHRDCHVRNVFLHYQTPTSPYPDVFLGNFCNAQTVETWERRLDIDDMVMTIKYLVACHVDDTALDPCRHSGVTWKPYSGTLKRTVELMNKSMYDRFGDLVSDAVYEMVERQFSFWTQSCNATDVCSKENVAWTKPCHSTSPLLFNEKQLADVVRGYHPKSTELYGEAGSNKEPEDWCGIIRPWDFTLVDKATLSIIKVLTEEEVSEYVEAWSSVDYSDPDETELGYDLKGSSKSSSREKKEASQPKQPLKYWDFI